MSMNKRPWPAGLLLGLLLAGCGAGRTPLGTLTDPEARTPGPIPPSPAGMPPGKEGQCPSGTDLCGACGGALCFDLQTSANNCGGCGRQCPPGVPCESGRCSLYTCRGDVTMKTVPIACRATGGDISLGDVDGDGFLDVVCADADADYFQYEPAYSVRALLGKGDGTFEQKPSFPVGHFGTGITPLSGWSTALVDLNHDGILDLVAGGQVSDTLAVRLGRGDGTFGSETDYSLGAEPVGFLVADVSGDGCPDLVAGLARAGAVSVSLGAKDGTFAAAATLPVVGSPGFVATADWNGDSISDLIAFDTYLHILLGTGGGVFAKALDCAVSLDYHSRGGSGQSTVLADFDQDGRIDLPLDDGVLFGMNECNFSSRVGYSNSRPLETGDFNGDGLPDLVLSTSPTSLKTPLSLLVANHSARFSSPQRLPDAGQTMFGTAVAGDLNGDGRLDLILGGNTDAVVLLNTCLNQSTPGRPR
jgi:hypothetical protein